MCTISRREGVVNHLFYVYSGSLVGFSNYIRIPTQYDTCVVINLVFQVPSKNAIHHIHTSNPNAPILLVRVLSRTLCISTCSRSIVAHAINRVQRIERPARVHRVAVPRISQVHKHPRSRPVQVHRPLGLHACKSRTSYGCDICACQAEGWLRLTSKFPLASR